VPVNSFLRFFEKFFGRKILARVDHRWPIARLTRGAAHRKIFLLSDPNAHITTRSNALPGNRALRLRVLRRLWP
jgi:hypothetical protein